MILTHVRPGHVKNCPPPRAHFYVRRTVLRCVVFGVQPTVARCRQRAIPLSRSPVSAKRTGAVAGSGAQEGDQGPGEWTTGTVAWRGRVFEQGWRQSGSAQADVAAGAATKRHVTCRRLRGASWAWCVAVRDFVWYPYTREPCDCVVVCVVYGDGVHVDRCRSCRMWESPRAAPFASVRARGRV